MADGRQTILDFAESAKGVAHDIYQPGDENDKSFGSANELRSVAKEARVAKLGNASAGEGRYVAFSQSRVLGQSNKQNFSQSGLQEPDGFDLVRGTYAQYKELTSINRGQLRSQARAAIRQAENIEGDPGGGSVLLSPPSGVDIDNLAQYIEGLNRSYGSLELIPRSDAGGDPGSEPNNRQEPIVPEEEDPDLEAE